MTIKDIAQIAGVSTATVSRVVNQNGLVKPETRKKIIEIMKKRNYSLNQTRRKGPHAHPAMKLKHRNFTMIWTNGHEASATATGHEMMFGITEATRPLGINVNVDFISTEDEFSDILKSGRTDGLFLHGNVYPKVLKQLAGKFPAVWLLQSGAVDFGDRVQPDHEHAGRLAYTYLKKSGCKNLCCISDKSYSHIPMFWESREDAFCRSARLDAVPCEVLNLDCDDELRCPIAEQVQIVREAIGRFKALSPRPDGIFVANMFGSLVHAELVAQNIIPMKDVMLVAGDAVMCNTYLNPEPAKIDIHPKQIGRLAVEMMLSRIKCPDLPQTTQYIKPTLIEP